MNKKFWPVGLLVTLTLLTSFGCMKEQTEDSAAQIFDISIVTDVRPDVSIPEKDNEVELAIEAYTNTKVDFQWIPSFSYEDKVSFIMASNSMPKLLKLRISPGTINALKSGMFWEIGPLLPSYPNLNQHAAYFNNIAVDGKIYGVPTFRDTARSVILFRKDWMETLNLQMPASLEEWYQVIKAMRLGDPDGNGVRDTYGMVLGRDYNVPSTPNTPMLPLLAIGEGGYNEWGIVDGKFVPDFEAEPYLKTMKLFRRLYAEDLINPDFAIYDASRDDFYRQGRSGFISGVALSAKIYQEELSQKIPGAQVDVAPLIGTGGRRVPAEPGNNGFFAISKSSVQTEGELRRVLGFLDQLLDEPMSNLQLRGIEGKHYVLLPSGKAKTINLIGFQNEVKPYRDNLINLEGYQVLPLEDTPLGDKARRMITENKDYAVENPAFKLYSKTYAQLGAKLEAMIAEAQTKFIMGQLDEAGWRSEVEKWHKAGGDQMILEYEEEYRKALQP
jgi:putative aldouronate transport system substrate-binding protein